MRHRVTSVISPPAGVHPLWWALTSVVGMTPHRIRTKARLARSVTDALVTGRSPRVDSDAMRRLATLLEWGRDELMRDAPNLADVTPALRAYRRATFNLISDILADFSRPRAAPAVAPRQTDLSRDLIRTLGPHGRRRDLAIADLRHVHRPAAIRRAARRVGVREELVDGHVHWIAPPLLFASLPPSYPAPDAPVYHPPTGDRQRRLHDAISIFLGRQPNCRAAGRDVVAHLAPLGYHRSAIFRAARDMNLVRTTTGFGPSKRAVWELPSPPPRDAPDYLDADLDGEYGARVDDAAD